MITLEDCIAFCELEPDEIAAVAEHEHVPEIVAAEIAQDLLDHPGGVTAIRQLIVDDIRRALAKGQRRHAAELLLTLRRFLHQHPEARMRSPIPSQEMCEELAAHSRSRLDKPVDHKVRQRLERELHDWQSLAEPGRSSWRDAGREASP